MNHWNRQLKDFVKEKCKGMLTISDRFLAEYLSSEKIRKYDKKQYSFFLGYWAHLVTDDLWARRIWTSCKEKYRELTGLTGDESAEEKQRRVWTIKADWYDQDFLYLQKHPDFRAFQIYRGAVDFKNEFLDFFAEDAFENRREYITEFYLAGRENVDREYSYLTEEQAKRFVGDAAERIYLQIVSHRQFRKGEAE